MHDQDKLRIRSACLHLVGLILCAGGLWALRRGHITWLAGQSCGILPLRSALYLLCFTPALIGFLWQLFRIASNDKASRLSGWFVVGVLFVGLGLGMHDTATHIRSFGQPGLSPRTAEACHFYDEQLGHLVFWVGFILTTVSTGLVHLSNPTEARQSWPTCATFVMLGMPLAAVMLGNLMFEKTGRDLVVIGVALGILLAAHAWKRVDIRCLPLLCMLYPAYLLAVAGTLLHGVM